MSVWLLNTACVCLSSNKSFCIENTYFTSIATCRISWAANMCFETYIYIHFKILFLRFSVKRLIYKSCPQSVLGDPCSVVGTSLSRKTVRKQQREEEFICICETFISSFTCSPTRETPRIVLLEMYNYFRIGKHVTCKCYCLFVLEVVVAHDLGSDWNNISQSAITLIVTMCLYLLLDTQPERVRQIWK